ncbi:phage tail spike protein [Bacillus thuringiensis]|uniref:Endopeptidase n=1 Tax=Bacillus thuringiensis TaxID=1428 RepID=A0A9W3TB44_BACTU|nr:phage tail spike protein [Bacillus thuringiensis]AQY37912.1 endopeptidase [Bacillus thuringiensis]MDR4147863.1 endopeptidase [Bacillus thuringiensis]MEC3573274.1 phage tail spike protein [Bacillus thuringiensis]MED2022014.1 phage tail spike protein [Bacillus thuringiensis]MED2144436.1 phage tail spike protein [Bacillus thuringiensis]
MITLYKPNETDFTHNGIGVLDKHIYSATVEEELNGLFVFNFNYPLFAPYGTKIDGMSIIKVPTPDGDQLFRVVTPKVSMGEIKAVCYHIFYDLTENLIEDIFIQPTNGSAAMARLSSGCQYKHPFTFYSDVTNISTARIVRKNPVEAMLDTSQDNSFVNRWGGELKRDNFDVKMLKSRGANRGVVIRHKKDLLGYEGSVDWKSPTTRIMPQGFDGLLLPEKYVDSPLINKYPYPRIRVIEFNHIKAAIGKNANDEDALPLEEAYKKLRQAAKDMFDIQMVDQPKATYKVEFQELSQTEEYKEYKILQRVWMGDIVTVKHEEDGIDIQAKVIAYKYDPIKKEYINVTIGNFKESFTDVTGKVDQIQQDLSNMPGSLLGAAKENATKLINSGFGGNVRVYPDRILIMDTKNEMTASKVWQWNINGLGYSSNGVNGPYEIAMTSDGRIVADFITTGVLNGNLIRGGEITGTTLRTANDSNYVSISKQFIRLMESYITRIFMGYYINNNNVMQPTIVLGGNNDITATQGAVLIYQLDGSPKSGGIGISNGYQNGDPTRVYFSASLAFNKNGHAELSSDQSLELESKESYASLKCQNNLFLESKAGGAYFAAKEGFNFRQNGDRIVDLKLTPGGDSDIVFQNILLRNNRNYESTYVQVKSGGGTYFNGVLAADFKVSSKKKYKTNIRDIKFDALEKVMGWEIKQYNLKTEMAQLYDMRMNRKEGDPLLTTNDITTHYGVVLPDESKENGVGLYGMIAQTVKAFQEYVAKTDARIEELEPIKPKGNIKHRNKVKRQRRPPRRVKRNS